MDLGTSSTVSSWIYSIAFINANFTNFFISPLVEEFGWRKVAFVSGIVLGTGMIISAFAKSAWNLFISFSAITGIFLKDIAVD